jgi:hypothetical protein
MVTRHATSMPAMISRPGPSVLCAANQRRGATSTDSRTSLLLATSSPVSFFIPAQYRKVGLGRRSGGEAEG